jgi:LysR family hydrogen peroxide-inducible transcriptional activator
MVTLRQMRYLAALADHRHFGRAAEACRISQPALSMQIRALERMLGVGLVERRPGEVLLTEIGAQVVERGRGLLAAARDLTDLARHSADVLTGRLSLGIIPSLAPYLLPRLLPGLQRRYPDLRLELRETQTRTLLQELAQGALDVLLLALPVGDNEIETLPLFEDHFLLAVPASDTRSAGQRVCARDIDPDRLILLEEGHCLREQALAYCALRENAGASVGLGATSLTTVMQMVANGYGITLVPEVAVDVEVRDERVRLLRFAPPGPGRTIGLAWRQTSPRRADFVTLGEVVNEAVGRARVQERRRPASSAPAARSPSAAAHRS